MYLLSDFEAKIREIAERRPESKALLSLQHAPFMAQLDAMATMAHMISVQVETAAVEAYIKARDGTVLADAAAKGVLPLGKPARVVVVATNAGISPVTLAAGRRLADGKGRIYRVEGAVTVPAGGSASVTLVQSTVREYSTTVAVSVPFQQLQIAPAEDGSHFVGVSIADADGAYTYAPDYASVEFGAKAYNVETDEYRRMYAVFGSDGSTGQQPQIGDVLTFTITECAGELDDLQAGSAYSLESINTAAEGSLEFELDEVTDTGADPHDIASLRTMARYQGLHDENAVFRGQWDLLLRKHLGNNLLFLSLWNEQVEEEARGASVDNINRLFVAAEVDGQSASLTQQAVKRIIKRADNSYRITHVSPRECVIPVAVTASVPAINDPDDVSAQIKSALVEKYGRGSAAASRGLSRGWRDRDAHALLADKVTALQDNVSDYRVLVGSYGDVLPEDWAYVTSASITVTVTRVSDQTGLWTA